MKRFFLLAVDLKPGDTPSIIDPTGLNSNLRIRPRIYDNGDLYFGLHEFLYHRRRLRLGHRN